jgi:hypothetical protein
MGSSSSKTLFNFLIEELHVPNNQIIEFNKKSSSIHLIQQCQHVILVSEISFILVSDLENTLFILFPNSKKELAQDSFSRLSSLISFQICSKISIIGDRCFSQCTSLISILIPNSVTSIGIYCFSQCTSLTSILIPNFVTWIGNGCFNQCTSLTSILIPNSVTWIGIYYFSQCTSIQNVSVLFPTNFVNALVDCQF